MPNIKYYHLQVEETNGEQGYMDNSLVVAKSEKEARIIAAKYMKKEYYPMWKPVVIDEDTFEFDSGNIRLHLNELWETTEEHFRDYMLKKHLLNPRGYALKEICAGTMKKKLEISSRWKCSKCDTKIEGVGFGDLTESGTPICGECGEEMDFAGEDIIIAESREVLYQN